MHTAFIAQNDDSKSDLWLADSNASCHITHDKSKIYGIKPSSPVVKLLRSGTNVALRLNVWTILMLNFTDIQTNVLR